jgi:hypothetical protein
MMTIPEPPGALQMVLQLERVEYQKADWELAERGAPLSWGAAALWRAAPSDYSISQIAAWFGRSIKTNKHADKQAAPLPNARGSYPFQHHRR